MSTMAPDRPPSTTLRARLRMRATGIALTTNRKRHGKVCGYRAKVVGDRPEVAKGLGRCVVEGSPDVVGQQAWILAKDLCLGDPIGQHTHNELHRNPSAPDHGLAHHDVRIYGDALPKLLV